MPQSILNVTRIKNPAALYDPSPFGYSHVAIVEQGDLLVFVAGQGGEDNTGNLVPGGYQGQLDQAFANVATALHSEGLELVNVIKLTVLIVDHDREKLTHLAKTVKRLFPQIAPTCTLIPVPRLAVDGMLVEVDATAVAR